VLTVLRGRATGAAETYWGEGGGGLGRGWNNGNGTSKLRFPHNTEFLRKLCTVWTLAPVKTCQSCPRLKKFKEYRFEGAPNIVLRWELTCLGPALFVFNVFRMYFRWVMQYLNPLTPNDL
jgi:hypothetical protein